MATQETPELSSDKHTKSTPTHWLILSEEIQILAEWLPHWANEKTKQNKNPHQRVRKAECSVTISPTWQRNIHLGRNSQSQIFPGEWRVWLQHPVPQLLPWFSPEWRAPKTSHSESPWRMYPWQLWDMQTKIQFLKAHWNHHGSPPGISPDAADRYAHLSVVPERGLSADFKAAV